ncbi:MAG: hypothetical protein ACXAAK_11010 [Candidatus Thorarchaeota archaeon]|jgi:uncharacterized protein (UPF0333 family)
MSGYFIGRCVDSKDMVSRSLEKMMLIAIGLSTAVIVGVPVLMYAIDTINTTSELQEVQFAADKIHNATISVDSGTTNTTTITVWINPGVTVNSAGNLLTVIYSRNGGAPRTWSESYIHEISIDENFSTPLITSPYTMEITLMDNVIHIRFFAVPI